jgi:hypothetical protein
MSRTVYYPGEEPDPTQKLFYYDVEAFFDLSRDETFYRTVTADADKLIADLHALTEDRRAIFDVLLKRGASEAQKKLQAYNRDITDAFQYNTNPSATVEEINDIETEDLEEDLVIEMEDGGTITLGDLVVTAGQFVKYDGTEFVLDTSGIKYILYYLDLPYGFDLNNINPLDEKIFELIVMYVVKEWFKRQKYDLQLVLAEYENVSDELKSLLNCRSVPVRRPSGP